MDEESLFDAIKQHFDAEGMVEIEVPEWAVNGQPLIIYAKPFNIYEQNKINKKMKSGNEIDSLVFTLILKALDKDGKPIFSEGSANKLRLEADPTVISGIVGRMRRAGDDEEGVASE